MLRSEKRAGAVAAALLLAGVLLALASGRFPPRSLGREFSYILGRTAPPAAVATYREEKPAPLGSRDLQGVAVGEDGRIAVIAESNLVWLDADLNVRRHTPLPGPAFCLAFAAGRIYVGLKDRIAVLDREGTPVAVWESLGERAWLTSIAVRGEDVVAADAGQRLVWRFDTGGRLRGNFGRKDQVAGEEGFVVPSPFFDLAFAPQGDLWVVNPGLHRVQRRTLEGRLLESWGETALGPEGFTGCCNPSHLAVFEDGSFATSEKGTPRVKRYDRSGHLIEVIAGPESFAPFTIDLDLAVDGRGRLLVLDPLRGELRVFSRGGGGPGGSDDG